MRRLLEILWLIRAFEEEVSHLTATGEVVGLIHVSTGQEAVAAGVCAHLGDDDAVYSGHRAHGHFLARGADPDRLMAELMGRAGGLCGGKGGSMHLVQADRGLLGATGVVGGNLPLALGTAFAKRELGAPTAVTVVFFGDGAAQAGVVHESLNLASVWGLPVLFVCENNGYAEFTPRAVHTRVRYVADLAAPYGIPAEQVDGNDVLAVHATADGLIQMIRGGAGPALLECHTYRLRGHYEGDPTAARRGAEELAEWKARDPIQRLVAAGQAAGWLSDRDAADAEASARARVGQAVAFGRSSPWPGMDALTSQVYA